MRPPLAAVVVNYHAGEHLVACVRSLHAAGVDDIVVVDNGSEDGSVAALEVATTGVRIVDAGANLGYGGGANQGVAATTAGAVLVCNADTVVDPGAPKALLAALDEHPSAGIIGPRIDEAATGERYPSARRFPSVVDALGHAFVGLVTQRNRFSRRYLMTDGGSEDQIGGDGPPAGPVDWVSGACFLARREAYDQIGGFDEGFFMYLEDVDLCWRLRRAGWDVRYEPAARVAHVQGVSTARHPYRMLIEHHRSLLRYWWRTAPPAQRLLAPVVTAGIALRLLLISARRALVFDRHGQSK